MVGPDQITTKPANMSWEVAGGFSAGAQTADIGLREIGVGAGDTVLIHGAAGAVGTIAVQLCRLWGATVIGAARESQRGYLRSLGAVPIGYGDRFVDRVRSLAPHGVHACLDGVGGEALDASLELVQDRCRILTLVEHGKAYTSSRPSRWPEPPTRTAHTGPETSAARSSSPSTDRTLINNVREQGGHDGDNGRRDEHCTLRWAAAPRPNAMTRLRVGVVLPSLTAQRRDRIDLRIAARHAENAGLDSVWHGDHLATGQPSLDIAVGLATAAAVTERVSIGAGVFIPAIRPLAWAAKQIASVQHVSNGRLILGVGSGGGPAQWAAAGVPYVERGARTDLALDLLPAMLGGEPVLIGDQEIVLAPAVTRPPFWVGNAASIAIRRAARVGDGWFPSLVPPSAVAVGAARLADLADTPREIAVGTTGALGDGMPSREEIAAKLGASHDLHLQEVPITGGPHEAASRLTQFQNAGATHIVMGFADGDWRSQCDLLAEAVRLL